MGCIEPQLASLAGQLISDTLDCYTANQPPSTPIKSSVRNHNAMIIRSKTNMATQECPHHWIIEAADGPVSRGICKLCKLVREFKNTVVVEKWGYFRLPESDDSHSVE